MAKDSPETVEDARTGAERAYLLLRADIVAGDLAPGQKLKTEMLKDRYGLSVGPLREAMSRLSAERLIDQEGQRGFRVAPLRAKEAAEIGEMRLLVEAEALRKSIPAGDTAWEEGVITTFFRLEQVETAPGRDAETLTRWEGLNARFHTALVAACPNAWLLQTREAMFRHHERYRHLSRIETRLTRDVHAEHKALMQAALDRDPEAAVLVIRGHIAKTTAAVTAAIAALEEGADAA